MSKQRPFRSTKREMRKRREKSGTDANQLAAGRSMKATNSQHSTKRHRSSLRAGLAVMGGRAAGALSRRLHLGGGTSITGLVAQSLYPDIVEHLSTQLAYGSILVTGTNGKTTTSGFIAAILSDAGLRVWRNREGSNLMRGIARALAIRAKPHCTFPLPTQALSLFQPNQTAIPQHLTTLHP